MTAKTSKTIDNLGFEAYRLYEEQKRSYDQPYITESKAVAAHLETDIFEPILFSDYQTLFDLAAKGNTWGQIQTPPHFNDQKKRLFTYQLAPKLGPEEYIEMQIERIEDSMDELMNRKKNAKQEDDSEEKEGRLFSWHEEEDNLKTTIREAGYLIEFFKSVNILNNIMTEIHSERNRFSKG